MVNKDLQMLWTLSLQPTYCHGERVNERLRDVRPCRLQSSTAFHLASSQCRPTTQCSWPASKQPPPLPPPPALHRPQQSINHIASNYRCSGKLEFPANVIVLI